MSERQIVVVEMGAVWPGEYIAEVDADYPLGSTVPAEDYDVEEQDWQHVLMRKGYADLPTFVLAHHDGTPYTVRWQSTATVWTLCDENRVPVRQEVELEVD